MAAETLARRGLAALLAAAWLALAVLLLFEAAAAAAIMPALAAILVGGLCLLAALRHGPARTRTGVLVVVGLLAFLLSLSLLPLPLPLAALSAASLPADPLAPDGAYAFALAASLTGLYAGLLLRPPRGALAVAGGTGALVVLLAGMTLATGRATSTATGVPAGCVVPVPAETAQVRISARAEIDGNVVGEAHLAGLRAGSDEHWQAQLSATAQPDWAADYVLAGGRAWLRRDAGTWTRVQPPPAADGSAVTLDGRLLANLAERPRAAFENLGLDELEHGAARHCRVAIDGASATDAALALGWLIGGGPVSDVGHRLALWRGELDWWTGHDARLLKVRLVVGGHPNDAWASTGARRLRGLLMAELSVEQPATRPSIREPLP